MSHQTNVKGNEDDSQMTKEVPGNDCLTKEEEETVELANVTKVPSRDWQIECSLNECLLNVYQNNRWTDMVVKCGNQENSIRAHKIILAARSPVFEAMLFGPCSDGKTEYNFPDTDPDIFDMMLRFMYNDDANLTSVDDAIDLMQMAHMYQITSLVGQCAQFLHTNITVNNVCKSLDCALKYNTHTLRDACCDFIDRNVINVMQTDGFMKVSNECLTYILKGDTFFADEDVIFQRVEEWAKLKLAEAGKEVKGTNIRNSIGEAFYHLRLSTLPAVKLLECIKRKGLLSANEYVDIVDCDVERQPQVNVVSNVPRIPLAESVTVSSNAESKRSTNIVQEMQLKIAKDCYLECIKIPFFRMYKLYNKPLAVYNYVKSGGFSHFTEGQYFNHNVLLSVEVTIDKINLKHRSNIRQLPDESSKVVFDTPVLLKKRDSPFDLRIKIEPICTDPNVLLDGTYGSLLIASDSAVLSISQSKACMIGINEIGIRNCSFRDETEDPDIESADTEETEDVSDS